MTNDEIKAKKERIKELEKQIAQKQAESDYNNAMQLALKLVINGTYGAFANKHFVCSNPDIANAITAHGRDVVQYMNTKIENYFYSQWHEDKKAHKLLGKEYVGLKEGKYSFYTKELNPSSGSFKELKDLLDTRNISTEKLTKIENIENNKDVEIIYEYHIHDFNNVTPIDDEPYYLKEGDEGYEGFKAYYGDKPVIIYGDTDSLYISYTPIMESVGYEGNELEFILHMDNVFIKHLFENFLDEYANPYKVENLHDFELETINKSSLFIEKKNYLNNVVWEEGVFHKDLSYFYPKGVEIVRSSTPEFVRERIYDVINYIFSNPDNISHNKVQKILKELKKEFEWTSTENIDAVSMTTSCSNYDDKVIDDTNGIVTEKGTHFGVKAAAFHNFLLNKNPEYKKKYDMVRSGRIKYYYCNHHLNDVFGYLRSFHPTEITTKEGVGIDIDTQFEKTFLTLVNRFLEPLGIPKINKRIGVIRSLFDLTNQQ